ncbi:hypothetical protein [Cryptosporidium parvum Iowa II]|uniref:Uncharacterized protein n=2 Tax=Cryptosporidium parvum TaxID=5807 RepID=Q5CTK3_CRYPI|nr:hypothetical protein [Cryptosporidium parvum Iowa II]EAK88738.1 hypothetical protein cgd2_2640 [Cryptosporidium parvum Iowa II]QOY42967.1 Uncharacterized protein CPATCC_0028150 [Cryptosporidium parvum]WKS76562.1 hypothetical protein CPCDC_2g2640 [Cryptosporidium sp. 43IA8]WRK31054.1 Uncharacterized protein cpbgf_2002640 [Cryptosporidium parvum]|eukprot:QOY42967.1 hypothetical protein CPATCC_000660 [Cryptosporidium parvum]
MYECTDICSQREVRLSIFPEKYPEKRKISEEIQTENIELQTDWSTKCCCTSRVKFSDTDIQEDATIEGEGNSGGQIIDEIANVISNYRRDSVLNTISEFEKKLLTIGMAEELSPENSDTEGSEYGELNIRRHSELAFKPLVLSAVENRRATAPDNMKRKIIDQLKIQINEDNTEELRSNQIPPNN